MKAWIVTDKGGYCETAEIVFADKPSRAKAIAMNGEVFQGDYLYTELRASRLKMLDKAYKGQAVADWNDPDIRIPMVKKMGWSCLEPDPEECEQCVAKEHCLAYQEGDN